MLTVSFLCSGCGSGYVFTGYDVSGFIFSLLRQSNQCCWFIRGRCHPVRLRLLCWILVRFATPCHRPVTWQPLIFRLNRFSPNAQSRQLALPVQDIRSSPGRITGRCRGIWCTDSPTGQAPVVLHSPTFGLPLGHECLFLAANPHPRIGNDLGGCAYRFTT